MKISLKFVLYLGFIFQLCSCGRNHTSVESSNNSDFQNDTIEINEILNKVINQKYNNPDSAYKNLKLAGELAEKCNYIKGQATAQFLHGNLLYNQNKYDEALKHYSEACNLAQDLQNPLLKAQCLERMASVHLATDDPNLALNLYYESLPLFEKVNNKQGIAKVYNIIGIYKTDYGEYDTAEVYFRKAIKLNREINDTLSMIQNQGNLGYLYEKIGQPDKAEEIYLGLVVKLKAIHDSINLPVIYSDLASLARKKNKLNDALRLLGKAILISEKTHDTALLASLYLDTGDIYYSLKKKDSAMQYSAKSAECSKVTGNARTAVQAFEILHKIDSSTGNYKDAYLKSRVINILKDTVYQRKLRNNLRASELQYENEKNKNLIELQQLKIQSSKRESVFYLVLWIISILAIALSGMLFYMKRRNYLKSKKLYENHLLINKLEIDKFQKEEEINKLKINRYEKEIGLKEKELVNIALRIEQKNELLNQVSKKIADTFQNESKENTSLSLKEVIASIEMQLGKSEDADLFNERFASLHHDFFIKIKKQHPCLTKTDLKFCAFLRIHLSSGQIATILSVTNEAIRKTRYRIRKKIGLSPKDSLEDYISQF